MPVTVLGLSGAIMPVSVMTTTSQSSRSRRSASSASKFGEPDSSSPSISSLRLTAGVSRPVAARCARRPEQVEQQLPLVVGRAAGTQDVAVDRRVERVGVPQLDRVDRLHVVVAVDDHRRRVGVGAGPLGVDGRQPGRRPDLDGREARAPGGVGEPFGAAVHVGVVVGLGADAGDAQPGVEVGEQFVAVFGDEEAFGCHPADDSLRAMSDRRDVVVIGAGLTGSAAAWALTSRGLSVTLVEQFAPGHEFGSSHGSARIVRRAYGDPLYTALTGRAFELWDSVSLASGAPLLRILGGLDFGPPAAVEPVAASLSAAGVPFEALSVGDAEARWPGMRFEGDVLFHEQAGTLDSGAAIDAFVLLATRGGADVRWSTPALSITPAESGATVQLADGTSVSAGHVVVAAGAWVAPLLAGLVDLPPLVVTQQQVFHFPRVDPSCGAVAERHPPRLRPRRRRDLPPGWWTRRRACTTTARSASTRAAARRRLPPATGSSIPASRARVIEYVQRWLPGLSAVPSSEATCLYTQTPSEDFVLDRVGALIVCSPCSGHGAKFAPLIGEFAADLATGVRACPIGSAWPPMRLPRPAASRSSSDAAVRRVPKPRASARSGRAA